jgi:hypothetical protein
MLKVPCGARRLLRADLQRGQGQEILVWKMLKKHTDFALAVNAESFTDY